MEIQYLKHSQIDIVKWDSALENSELPLFYALSWYLDIVSPDWEALVYGDYKAVMPLTVKRKYGLRYVIQPSFAQQLGCFCKAGFSNVFDDFIKKTSDLYKYCNIQLNYTNPAVSNFNFQTRINCELNFTESFQDIYKNYNTNTKRNISKANKNSLEFVKDLCTSELIQFIKRNSVENLSKNQFKTLEQIIIEAEKQGVGQSYGILNEKKEILAVAFLINKFDRLTYLASASNEEGKEKRAGFYLMNELLKMYSGSNMIFDFEGGNMPNTASFYKGFGAMEREYLGLKINKLPYPLKWFKC
ncbi:MAG: hypothetical protein KAR57_04650 [Bacteroidales bacterium]|nr:hypothetical protein [Bacteroidales bacterium]